MFLTRKRGQKEQSLKISHITRGIIEQIRTNRSLLRLEITVFHSICSDDIKCLVAALEENTVIQDLRVEYQQTSYSNIDDTEQLVRRWYTLLLRNRYGWSPSNHYLFPGPTKESIETIFKLWYLPSQIDVNSTFGPVGIEKIPAPHLPAEILFIIFSFLC